MALLKECIILIALIAFIPQTSQVPLQKGIEDGQNDNTAAENQSSFGQRVRPRFPSRRLKGRLPSSPLIPSSTVSTSTLQNENSLTEVDTNPLEGRNFYALEPITAIPRKTKPIKPETSLSASKNISQLGCEILGVKYRIGELVGVATDPCLECRCALDALYCSPKCCFQPAEPDDDVAQQIQRSDGHKPLQHNPLQHLRSDFEPGRDELTLTIDVK
uniref:VWFC domain-containing protein n=1 Tax=Strigamia maritima TaxID=126957 RepID=T1JB94_STRMM